MKIVLFQGGNPGREHVMPGDKPERSAEAPSRGDKAGVQPKAQGGAGGPGWVSAESKDLSTRPRGSGSVTMADLEELLGGEMELAPITRRLALVSRADGEAERLPIHYCLHRLGRAVEPVAGDCAVIALGAEGRIVDVRPGEIDAANEFVRPVRGA